MENPVVNIGAVLRDQREKLGYSLKEVSQHTRIRKTFLESLEENKFSDLPGHVYVVGFVKVYSLYLGLDSNSLLAELEEPEEEGVSPSLESIPIIKSQSRHSSKHTRDGWRAFVIGLLVILILGGAIYFLLPMFQTRDLAKETSKQIAIEPRATEPRATEPRATEPRATEPRATEQKPAPVEVEVAERVIKTEQTVVTTSPKEEPTSVAVETKTQQSKLLPPVLPQGSSLRILALSESSLTIYVDDRKPQHYALHDGLDLTWNIRTRVKVELAGSGVARFWLDGQELDLDELKFFQLQPERP